VFHAPGTNQVFKQSTTTLNWILFKELPKSLSTGVACKTFHDEIGALKSDTLPVAPQSVPE